MKKVTRSGPEKQRFSMFRSYTVADLFTLGNASSGTLAIFLCLNYIAEGQKSQAQVLGESRVVELRKFELMVDRLLTIVQAHPDILTTALSNAHKFVPDRVITVGGEGSGGSSLPGAMSILCDMLSPGRTTEPPK